MKAVLILVVLSGIGTFLLMKKEKRSSFVDTWLSLFRRSK